MAKAVQIGETVTEPGLDPQAVFPARCCGQVVLDRCPVQHPLDFSLLVNLRPLGSQPEDSWMDLLSRVPSAESMIQRDDTSSQFQAAHQCALLTVWLPFAHDLDDAVGRFNSAAASYVLAVALWLNAPCEPIATLVVDTQTHETWSRMDAGRPLPAVPRAGHARDHLCKVMPALLSGGRMRLLVGMYRDVLLEPQDSAAIVKAWTVLETAAVNEEGDSALGRVRGLCDRMGATIDGELLHRAYEDSGRDLIQAAYLHRDCLVRHGWCNPKDNECRQSPCRHSSLLRLDLQMFLGEFLTGYVAISGWDSHS
jgi:hypothetical protein